jgi:hypothetical protein
MLQRTMPKCWTTTPFLSMATAATLTMLLAPMACVSAIWPFCAYRGCILNHPYRLVAYTVLKTAYRTYVLHHHDAMLMILETGTDASNRSTAGPPRNPAYTSTATPNGASLVNSGAGGTPAPMAGAVPAGVGIDLAPFTDGSMLVQVIRAGSPAALSNQIQVFHIHVSMYENLFMYVYQVCAFSCLEGISSEHAC